MAELQTVHKKKLSQQIAEQLLLLVEEGRIGPGDRLPPERDLARLFGASRHAVREAIRGLEQQGVLASKQGSGTYLVLGGEQGAPAALVRALLNSRRRLAEVFQFRMILEPQIAALAAAAEGERDIAALEEVFNRQKSAVRAPETAGGGQAWALADRDFHLTLARMTGNSVLVRCVEMMHEIVDQSRASELQTPRRRQASLKGHAEIMAAVKRGRPQAAARAMERHLGFIERLAVAKS
ncbi:hypothetical protein AAU61_06975 [Desulfocarbo indianensis]|nr:hypothetical protein AAU61_06975 [Desulfocarbo indianensis]